MTPTGKPSVWRLRPGGDENRPASAEEVFVGPVAHSAPVPLSIQVYATDATGAEQWREGSRSPAAELAPAQVFALTDARAAHAAGVFSSEGTWLGGVGWHAATDIEAHAVSRWRKFAPGKPVHDIEAGCWIGQAGDSIFGHALVDVVPRAMLLDQLAPAGVPLLVSSNASAALEPLLALARIGREVIRLPQRGSARVGTLFVGSSARQGAYFDNAQAPVFARMKRTALAESPAGTADARIYLSRLGIASAEEHPPRQLTGRAEVESIVSSHGFEVVSPETRPLPEQIALAASANVIAGEVGSAMHLGLFAERGSSLMVLRSVANPNPIDALCAGIAGLHMFVIEGPVTETEHPQAPLRAPWMRSWELPQPFLERALNERQTSS